MQPDDINWDDFTARREAPEDGEEPAGLARPSARNKRQGPSLSAVLMQAIHLAGSRRGRLTKADRIRERTLLEVLTETMRNGR